MDIIFSSSAVLELELWTRSLTTVFRHGWEPFWVRENGKSTLQTQLIGTALDRLRDLCQCQRELGSGEWPLWHEEEPEIFRPGSSPLKDLEDFIEAAQIGFNPETLPAGTFPDPPHPGLRAFRRSAYQRELVYRHFESRAEGVVSGAVLGRVSAPALKTRYLYFFVQMLRLSAYLRFIHQGLAGSRQPRAFLLAFVLVYRDLTVLSRRIVALGQSGAQLDPPCADALRLAHHAIQLESRRVFRRELRRIEAVDSMQEVRVRLEDSTGLLQNCLQNCFLVLARSFNPQFAGHPLIDDGFERMEQSVRLLNDLQQLAERVAAAGGEDAEFFGVLADLQSFSHRSMRYLRYRDQLELRDFIEVLARAVDRQSRQQNLHRLSIFLTTLHSEVGKRGALKGVSAIKARHPGATARKRVG